MLNTKEIAQLRDLMTRAIKSHQIVLQCDHDGDLNGISGEQDLVVSEAAFSCQLELGEPDRELPESELWLKIDASTARELATI